jgi:hypothetical protein
VSSPPQTQRPWRAPRANIAGAIPAVLRLATGERTSAKLKTISLTGGLLELPQPLHQGSQFKMMFLTEGGSVLGGAQMLQPVTQQLQPFRFTSIAADDKRRLGTLIWENSSENKFEQDWIEKLRAASAQQKEPRRWRLKLVAAGLVTVSLAGAGCLLHFGLLFGLLK